MKYVLIHHMLFLQIISDPLLQWLSLCASTHDHMLKGSIIPSLQCLWEQILDTLQNSRPHIIFDSRLLRVHASLLEAAFDHPHLPISEATILFWEPTYGMQTNLHYPPCLVPVLHKLSMEGRITLPKERPGNKLTSLKSFTALIKPKRILNDAMQSENDG